MSQEIPSTASIRSDLKKSVLKTRYFQVNVNSQKLNVIIDNLNFTIKEQDEKIQKMNRDFFKIINNLQNKLINQNERTGMMFTRLDKKIQENATKTQLYINQLDNQLKKQNVRDEQIQKQLQNTKKKLGLLQDSSKEDLYLSLSKLKEEIIGKKNSQKIIQGIQQTSQKQGNKPEQQNFVLKNMTTAFQYLNNQLIDLQKSIAPQVQQILQQHERKIKKCQKENLLKVQNLKQKILGHQRYQGEGQQKNGVFNSGLNKVVYANNKHFSKELGDIRRRQMMKEQRHHSFCKMNESQYQMNHLFRQIHDKISYFESYIQKNQEESTRAKNKLIILEQKSDILSRKIDKIHHQISEIKNNTRRIQNLKLDDKAIEQLRNYIKWAVRDLQDKIGLKCSQEDLDRQKKKLLQKISILHENLVQKAEKGEIQKALVFLEQKIKEIILLIASEQTEERKGSIIKTAFKCLSCDKEVEKNMKKLEQRQLFSSSSRQNCYSGSMTHRVRQKYKNQIKQNFTQGSQVDQF